MSSFARQRVLYHPLKHVWLRAKDRLTNTTTTTTKKKRCNVNVNSNRLLLEMGITERGLEDIGDISSVRWSAAIEAFLGNTNQNNSSNNSSNNITTSKNAETTNGTATKQTSSIDDEPINELELEHELEFEFERGDELLRIHFDGHSITSADELYHTVWETFSDHASIRSPVKGTMAMAMPSGNCDDDDDGSAASLSLSSRAKSLELDGIDDETVLVEITATEEEWANAHVHANAHAHAATTTTTTEAETRRRSMPQRDCFVTESEYLKIVEQTPRGAFY